MKSNLFVRKLKRTKDRLEFCATRVVHSIWPFPGSFLPLKTPREIPHTRQKFPLIIVFIVVIIMIVRIKKLFKNSQFFKNYIYIYMVFIIYLLLYI